MQAKTPRSKSRSRSTLLAAHTELLVKQLSLRHPEGEALAVPEERSPCPRRVRAPFRLEALTGVVVGMALWAGVGLAAAIATSLTGCAKTAERHESAPSLRSGRAVHWTPRSTRERAHRQVRATTRRPGASQNAKKEAAARQMARRPRQHVATGQPRRSPAKDQTDSNREAYDRIHENRFLAARDQPLSTFSVDVDTASYANLRRILRGGRLPPKGAVRIEEMINYFSYDYAPPRGSTPFSVHVDGAPAPWKPAHRLVRIGLKGRVVDAQARPASNLVFLIDVSGSMSSASKLGLLKRALALLCKRLDERDSVAIVVYAGAAGAVLSPTRGDQRQQIAQALKRLRAGGSTNGGAGIRLAYRLARAHYVKGGVNRVILATDGDFNVGTTSRSELVRLVERQAKSGVYLTILGFGMGNYQDATLEQLSNKGNGNYAYIDSLREARKVLVEGMAGTLMTIAKDVKIQVEFNPARVAAYRLIGYENRMLRKEDFNDDKKDAGDIGAGHTVTALYEIVPRGAQTDVVTPRVDALRYQRRPAPGARGRESDKRGAGSRGELLFVKLRYKQPEGDTSRLLTVPVKDTALAKSFDDASVGLKLAASVGAFGMLLRDSKHKGTARYADLLRWAAPAAARARDPRGRRAELLSLIRLADRLAHPRTRTAENQIAR